MVHRSPTDEILPSNPESRKIYSLRREGDGPRLIPLVAAKYAGEVQFDQDEPITVVSRTSTQSAMRPMPRSVSFDQISYSIIEYMILYIEETQFLEPTQ
ncbi:hypothetical protein HALLA_00450 (plasmid) [Halostagnicola larsenii XH-48]|uniref:Uncharacterized protein n=1 Tax=Halostagnicola larsenii XH-48 TaxID=797299 RepID=W0JXR2_9EURY|nr:hypothetical protein HALLA_00450 [Halostagnicola larsenii XH-48]